MKVVGVGESEQTKHACLSAAAEMTKKAVEENESVGKMDWDVMNKVLKNTINLDDEGISSNYVFLIYF